MMNRRDFLRAGAFSAGALALSFSPRAGAAVDAKSLDTAAGENLDTAIEKHRKADAIIRLQNASGQPVSQARLIVKQLSHEFLFGCNFFSFNRCESPEQEELYRKRFAELFNYCTLGFYWSSYERTPGAPSYDYTDQVLDWTRSEGITSKGHPLVWDHPAGSPGWLSRNHETIAELSNRRVDEIVKRFAGRIDIWDVVNEATHLPDGANKTTMAEFGKALGPVDYTRRPLEVAREANSRATLLVNDYRTDKNYYALLEQLMKHGSLYDVVGIQSHMHGGAWSAQTTQQVCDRFARLNLPLHFTEATLVSGPRLGPGEKWGPTTPELEEKQARETAEFYRRLFAHPSVEAITWWDFSDFRAWQGAASGLVRRDMSRKPAYDALHKLVKGAWWSREEVVTDGEGAARVRPFAGRYRISIHLPNGATHTRDVEIRRKQPNNLKIVI